MLTRSSSAALVRCAGASRPIFSPSAITAASAGARRSYTTTSLPTAARVPPASSRSLSQWIPRRFRSSPLALADGPAATMTAPSAPSSSSSSSSSTASASATPAVSSQAPGDRSKIVNAVLDAQADSGENQLVTPTRVAGTVDVRIDGEAGAPPPEDIAEPSFKRPDADWTLMHPLWKDTYVHRVQYTHLPPTEFVDKLAYYTIRLIRFNFDWMSGYTFGKLTEKKALTRIVFLETVAGVPGSIASTVRHLASLRRMKRDGGWIATLMAEAENERMHLLTFLEVRSPGPFMRLMVFLTQGLFYNFFFLSYLISPRFCHRLVGYLEEEAVVTYTKILHEIENGELKSWKTTPAPAIAKKYWKLSENSTLREVVAHVRADEAHHRDVNHTLASLKPGELNPFRSGGV